MDQGIEGEVDQDWKREKLNRAPKWEEVQSTDNKEKEHNKESGDWTRELRESCETEAQIKAEGKPNN